MSTNSRKLKVAVIGAGYFSKFHLDAWNQISEVELIAVCDIDDTKAAECSREYQIPKSYTCYQQMLEEEELDFVDIITPPNSHLPICEEAVARGIAIICQKPLAPSFAEAKQIVELANAAKTPFMVHENFRFQPWHREIKKLIASGTIGDQLHSISVNCRMGDGWQKNAYLERQPYFRTMPRLLIYETGIHFIDTFQYLLGDIVAVFANLRRLNDEILGEDTGCVLLQFKSGAQGLINATRYHESDTNDPRYTFGEYTIDGNQGTIHLDLDGKLTVKKLGHPTEVHIYEHSNSGFAGNCVLATQRYFIKQLINNDDFETSGKNYLNALTVQEAIYESAKLKQLIELPK